MNMSTKMEMSQVNNPANKVQTMQSVKINIHVYFVISVSELWSLITTMLQEKGEIRSLLLKK